VKPAGKGDDEGLREPEARGPTEVRPWTEIGAEWPPDRLKKMDSEKRAGTWPGQNRSVPLIIEISEESPRRLRTRCPESRWAAWGAERSFGAQEGRPNDVRE
jgi:hypothetical protein